MSIAELPSVFSSTAEERATAPWRDALTTLDHDLEALHRAMDEARANSWRCGDAIEPEFESFLTAITRPAAPARVSDSLPPGAEWAGRRNVWRETIDAWERTAAV